jgi:hypothetical protein
MKHYTDQDWIPFLFGEARREERRRLATHLAECPECAAEMAQWRQSLGWLDRWKLPKPRGRDTAIEPMLKWAVAALLLLGVGLAVGRWSASAGPDPKQLRAEVERSVRAALAGELADGLAAAEERWAQRSQAGLNRLRDETLETLHAARLADRQALYSLLQRLEQRHDAALIDLRKDLETVATLADIEIRLARLQRLQLAEAPTPADDTKP